VEVLAFIGVLLRFRATWIDPRWRAGDQSSDVFLIEPAQSRHAI
jgi:hypothetical protein